MPKWLTKLKIEEVSSVDKGANGGARVTLWKRGMSDDEMKEMKRLMAEKGMSEKEAMGYMADRRKQSKSAHGGEEDGSMPMDPQQLEERVAELEGAVERADKVNKALKDALDAEGFDLIVSEDSVELAKRDTDEEFVEFEGQRIRKSDPGYQIAKRAMDRVEALEQASERAAIAKRAEEVVPYLTGDDEVKVAVLSAIEKMDDKIKEGAMAMLKAANAHAHQATLEIGKNGEGSDDPRSADAQIEKLAKKAFDEGEFASIEVAKAAIAQSDEGRRIRAAARTSRH